MKRLTLIALLASAAMFAASRSETATYVDGNVPSVAPNTGGTLVLDDKDNMYFRTGLVNVPVAYSGISHAELGAVREISHSVPVYKVWALHKRFSGANKTQTQLLIVNFKSEDGEDRSMTLEMAESAAAGALETIESRTGKKFGAAQKTQTASAKKPEPKKADEWWGDDFWKTTRNADKWNKQASNNNQN
jgi:hypothetical protein